MAKLRINGDTSGYVDITVPAVAGATTLDVTSPTFTGPVVQKASGNGGSFLAVGNANQSGYLSLTNSANARVAYVGWAGTDSGNLELVTDSGTNLGMRMSTNGLERLKIDTSGRVTMPYQPAFSINQNGGTWTSGQVVVFSTTTNLNVGSHYSTANGRFTAPVGGNYYFSLTFLTPNSSAEFDVRLRKNGTTNFGAAYSMSGSSYKNGGVVAIMPLATNDYVEIIMFSSSGSLHVDAPHNVYSGFLIG